MLKQKAKGKQKRSFKDKQVFNDYLNIFNSLIIKWNFFFTFFSLSQLALRNSLLKQKKMSLKK